MVHVLWSAKGGSGTTVVACALALLASRSAPTVLVDLGGDVPAALGMDDVVGAGVLDWMAAPTADGEALLRLAADAGSGLSVVHRGGAGGTIPAGAEMERLVHACAAARSTVIIDAGQLVPPVPPSCASVLVTRPCFLALRRAAGAGAVPTDVVLVDEPGRALRAADVERAVSAPVTATVPWDPAVARSVDAGLLRSRLPGSLARPLRRLLHGVDA